MPDTITKPERRIAQATPYPDLALHTLGWKAFQDLCSEVCEVVLKRPVEIFREAQDGGQDAVFLSKDPKGTHSTTVQCKFSSKENERLQIGDLNEEFKSVAELVAASQASTYVIITNRRLDAPEALKVREQLRKLGVVHPHIFGRHYLTRAIRASSRLRALVPRVYGLGDLSTILDERSAQQTEALLGHLKALLKVYVTTEPHTTAVRSLSKHSIVLLLGDPGTGKSTIAAILSTLAASKPNRNVFRADGVIDFIARWNPNEDGFFWVDDAFGPNQLREDFVDAWLTHFPKVLAAIARGSQFVLTSRQHIYNGAERKLGSRNLAQFRDGHALVHVGTLSKNERLQLLYNHMKIGSQHWAWKSRIKSSLTALAAEPTLTPEIARRLADPAYTKQLDLTLPALLQFVREPKAHLLQMIREMSKEHRAALTLVFLHYGQMRIGDASNEMQNLISRYFGIDREALGQSVQELKGSFLVTRKEENGQVWAFKHPTIADAISAFLGETDGLVELYLRGTRPSIVISEITCSGSATILDAIVVPEALSELLQNVVEKIPDEPYSNNRLFDFLDTRTSDSFFKSFVSQNPSVLGRKVGYRREKASDARISVLARAHGFGLLPEGVRDDVARELSTALSGLDGSFLETDNILSLIPPTQLLQLINELRTSLASLVEQRVGDDVSDADDDIEPEDYFYELNQNLDLIQVALFGSAHSDSEQILEEIKALVDGGIEELQERKEEKKRKDEEDEWMMREWESRRLNKPSPPINPISTPVSSRGTRSIFSDVDE